MKKKNPDEECPPCRQGEASRVHGLIQAMLLLNVGESPRHGYKLFKGLSAELPRGMVPDVAVIYRILRKLDKEGYVASSLIPGEGGPARKVYSLTPEGEAYLAQWHESICTRVAALDLFLQKYEQFSQQLQTEEEEK